MHRFADGSRPVYPRAASSRPEKGIDEVTVEIIEEAPPPKPHTPKPAKTGEAKREKPEPAPAKTGPARPKTRTATPRTQEYPRIRRFPSTAAAVPRGVRRA